MNNSVRELSIDEIDRVEGGIVPAIVLLAVVVAGCATTSGKRESDCKKEGGDTADC
jgi:hypothetical protein